jgi:hypothetical protein
MRPTHSAEELAESFTALVVEELLPTHPRHMTISFPELETWGEEELDQFRQLVNQRGREHSYSAKIELRGTTQPHLSITFSYP